MSEDRIEVVVLGRNLGTASGWDGDPGETFWFYDFTAKSDINLPYQELHVDLLNGYIGTADPDSGEFTKEAVDIITFMQGVPRP